MIAHMYPSVLQAVSGQGYAGCLDGCFQGYRGKAMQDLGYDLPRIPIPRCEYPGEWLWAAPRTGLTLIPRGPNRCLASDSSVGLLGVVQRPPGAGAS